MTRNPFTDGTIRTICVEASKDGEACDAVGTIHFPDGSSKQYLAESMSECLGYMRRDLAVLQIPMPDDEDIREWDSDGYQHAYWDLTYTEDAPIAQFVEEFCKSRKLVTPPHKDPFVLASCGLWFFGFLVWVGLVVAYVWVRNLLH